MEAYVKLHDVQFALAMVAGGPRALGCRGPSVFWSFASTYTTTQHYHCVMIPEPIDISSVWPVLPPGVHDATLDEVEKTFATEPHRQLLFAGLKQGIEALRFAGCKTVYIDGSFVTGKPGPNDYDACWIPTGVDDKKLDSVLLDFTDERREQKKKFKGEFFPSSALADGQNTFVDYFQKDRYTDKPKGIIRIRLI